MKQPAKHTRKAPYWETHANWDKAGNCTFCGEAGRCKCSHPPLTKPEPIKEKLIKLPFKTDGMDSYGTPEFMEQIKATQAEHTNVSEHTPTPLQYTEELDLRKDLKDAGWISSRVDGIVRAVNSHEEMLTALRSVRNEFRAYVLNDPKNLETAIGSQVLAQIDRAITKAEASSKGGK